MLTTPEYKSVEVSTAIIKFLNENGEDIRKQVSQAIVLNMVRNDKISAGKGAELLNIPVSDFMDVMRENKIPYTDFDEEEIDQQLEDYEDYKRKTA